jgi:hypothetical protein
MPLAIWLATARIGAPLRKLTDSPLESAARSAGGAEAPSPDPTVWPAEKSPRKRSRLPALAPRQP